ncbi:MAG: hypothetical protein LBE36_13750 [Flavobacteriaceae bacterium]|jgi:hypothetical protein|nr:hypothetical protein [Flavobacteriaceae bacterium]
MEIFDFEIPGHSTRQEWAVYVIVAKKINSNKKILYVGKTGDNRIGCNPIISRIGNHFSHNTIHSQMRNNLDKLDDTTDYNYKIFYATFGKYNINSHKSDKDKINECERQLNCYVQEQLKDVENVELLNPYKGIGVSKIKKLERENLLTNADKETLKFLVEKVINK